MPRRLLLALIALLAWSLLTPCPAEAAVDCGAVAFASVHGAMREDKLLDGKVPAETAPLDDFTGAMLLPGGHVELTFGEPRRIGRIEIHASGNIAALARIGDTLEPLALAVQPGLHPGTRTLVASPPQPIAGLRLSAGGMAFIGEVALSCGGAITLERTPGYRDEVARLLERLRLTALGSAAVGLVALPLLFLAFRGGGRRAAALACVLVALAAASWTRFGDLQGDGRVVHAWDMGHYYLGAKYFDEMRHTELYRCIARHEIESGRGALFQGYAVRNLDDHEMTAPGWPLTPDGACRAQFSPERWRQFRADADDIRRLFGLRHFHSMLSDHGYNASPVFTAIMEPVTRLLPPPGSGAAMLDALALAAAVVATWWGFGPRAAAILALFVGTAYPWNYVWIGGALGRMFWLACAAVGMALLARNRPVLGAAFCCFGGLLRLFPLVLLAGPAAHETLDRLRRLSEARGLLLGMALATTAGVGLAVASFGWTALPQFEAKVVLLMRHGGINLFGFRPIAEAVAEGWPALALRMLALAASIGFLLWTAWRRAPAWECYAAAGPLLFCLTPLSSYDGIWMALLAPVAARRFAAAATLVGAAALSNLVEVTVADDGTKYLLYCLLFGAAMVGVFVWGRSSSRIVRTSGSASAGDIPGLMRRS